MNYIEPYKEIIETALEKLPASYEVAVRQSINDIEASLTFTEATDKYLQFINKYTGIAEFHIWHYWHLAYTFNDRFNSEEDFALFAEIFLLHGFSQLFNEEWKWYSHLESKYLNKLIETCFYPKHTPFSHLKYKIAFSKKWEDISSLPLNRFLPYFWKRRIGTSPLSKKQIESCQALHKQSKEIVAVKDDDEKWFELVTQTKDIPFIVQNVECRIGRKPWNKKMWSLYWQFLRDQNLMNLLLHSYSRYCRLFFEDIDMFEVYKVEVDLCSEASMNVVRWKLDIMKFETDHGITEANISPKKTHDDFALIWLNIDEYSMGIGLFRFYFDTEVDIIESGYFENPREAYSSLSDDILLPYVRKDYKKDVVFGPPPLAFSPKSSIEQSFSLPKSYLRYILDMESDYVTQRLYFTCKWFFMAKKTAVCYKLDIGGYWTDEQYYENTLFTSPASFINNQNLPNFSFTKVLSLESVPADFIPDIIHKTSSIAITELHLREQRLTLEEFQLLTKEVETLILNPRTYIVDTDVRLTIPEITDVMPKIKHVVFNFECYAFNFDFEPSTTKTLETFYAIFTFHTNVPTSAICKFIENYAASKCHFSIDVLKSFLMKSRFDEIKTQLLLTAISEHFNTMQTEKPRLTLTLNRKDYTF